MKTELFFIALFASITCQAQTQGKSDSQALYTIRTEETISETFSTQNSGECHYVDRYRKITYTPKEIFTKKLTALKIDSEFVLRTSLGQTVKWTPTPQSNPLLQSQQQQSQLQYQQQCQQQQQQNNSYYQQQPIPSEAELKVEALPYQFTMTSNGSSKTLIIQGKNWVNSLSWRILGQTHETIDLPGYKMEIMKDLFCLTDTRTVDTAQSFCSLTVTE